MSKSSLSVSSSVSHSQEGPGKKIAHGPISTILHLPVLLPALDFAFAILTFMAAFSLSSLATFLCCFLVTLLSNTVSATRV